MTGKKRSLLGTLTGGEDAAGTAGLETGATFRHKYIFCWSRYQGL
jgi:hypothetical protein